MFSLPAADSRDIAKYDGKSSGIENLEIRAALNLEMQMRRGSIP